MRKSGVSLNIVCKIVLVEIPREPLPIFYFCGENVLSTYLYLVKFVELWLEDVDVVRLFRHLLGDTYTTTS